MKRLWIMIQGYQAGLVFSAMQQAGYERMLYRGDFEDSTGDTGRPMDENFWYFRELFDDIRRAYWRYIRKCAHGPYWVDTSHAGPDSGDMSGYCARCGASMDVALY